MSSPVRRFNAHVYRRACRAAGLQTMQLARLAETSEDYLRHVARGLVPSQPLRERLSTALKVSADDLWPLELDEAAQS